MIKLEDYTLENWDKVSIQKSVSFKNNFVILLALFPRFPSKEGAKNLLSINSQSEILWVAELQESFKFYSSYDDVKIEDNKLIAIAGSIHCAIDPCTGELLNEKFIK